MLNVTYPLVPQQLSDFCLGKRAVLMMEEGQPEYIEQELATLLRRADIQTPLHGKDMLPQAGEYTTEVMAGGLAQFLQRYLPQHTPPAALQWLAGNRERRELVAKSMPAPLPARPPSMCVGCGAACRWRRRHDSCDGIACASGAC